MGFTLTGNSNNNTNQRKEREPSVYDGLWLNIGARTEVAGEDGMPEEKFCRLPRGVAVSDLEMHKIYGNTNPDWAKEASLVNQVIAAIQKKGPTLAEGESVKLNLDVVLYRRQETVDSVDPTADISAVESSLFVE